MEKQFENIPASGFTVMHQSTRFFKAVINAFEEGTITLSAFSIVQLLEGAEIDPDITHNEKVVSAVMFKAYQKLNNKFRRSLADKFNRQVLIIDRHELTIFIKWLRIRMHHCEVERDTRAVDESGNPKFNPDTYIGQKLLLMELLNLAMGDVVDIEPMPERE